MLKDTPIAYVERYEDALRLGEDEWRFRARRSEQGAKARTWVAEAPDGRWIGSLSAYVSADDAGPAAWIVAVYVAPDHRGRPTGIADRLLDAAVRWGEKEAMVARLLLEVREDNQRARAFYRRRGFVETGRTEPYLLDPVYAEVEMELSLRRSGR